jgi:hypothetical protein
MTMKHLDKAATIAMFAGIGIMAFALARFLIRASHISPVDAAILQYMDDYIQTSIIGAAILVIALLYETFKSVKL